MSDLNKPKKFGYFGHFLTILSLIVAFLFSQEAYPATHHDLRNPAALLAFQKLGATSGKQYRHPSQFGLSQLVCTANGNGLISVQLGSFGSKGNHKNTVDFTGDGLVNFVTPQGFHPNGRDITPHTAQHIVDNAINLDGVPKADNVGQVGQNLILGSSKGKNLYDPVVSPFVPTTATRTVAGNTAIYTCHTATDTINADQLSGDLGSPGNNLNVFVTTGAATNPDGSASITFQQQLFTWNTSNTCIFKFGNSGANPRSINFNLAPGQPVPQVFFTGANNAYFQVPGSSSIIQIQNLTQAAGAPATTFPASVVVYSPNGSPNEKDRKLKKGSYTEDLRVAPGLSDSIKHFQHNLDLKNWQGYSISVEPC